MKRASELKIVLNTPHGVIALSLFDLQQAIVEAEKLLGCLRRKPDSKPPPRAHLDATQLSELYGIDARWFLTRAREGRLPHVRIGKYVRFDPDEVREFFRRDSK